MNSHSNHPKDIYYPKVYLFNIDTLLYSIWNMWQYYGIVERKHQFELDFDNVIHDYLLLLRYYPSQKEAVSEILSRIASKALSLEIDDYTQGMIENGCKALLEAIYVNLQLCDLYIPGDKDYSKVRTHTLKIKNWRDQYMPVFEYVDYEYVENDLIERKEYFYHLTNHSTDEKEN